MFFVEKKLTKMSEGGEALPRLEYRLLDEEKGYPVLYYYNASTRRRPPPVRLRLLRQDQHVYEGKLRRRMRLM